MAPRAPTMYRTSMGTVALMKWTAQNPALIPSGVTITPSFMRDLETYMAGLAASGRNVVPAANMLAMTLAHVCQSFALEKSRGKYDPYQKVPEMAWMLPVRRISQRYYRNWKVRRLAPGMWEVYNDSREAYFIEYGIHTSKRRVRRPIMKMSLIKMLRWADAVGVGHRVFEQIFAPLRNMHHAPSKTRLFNLPPQRGSFIAGTNVQSPGMGMGNF